ncbi:retrovirus-related Pol polyprotein from transposon 297 [Trichonephila clavipes]|nr:retrovirus-related Pol polyprotein from transposon 297 [Trichonephila clavipes]
MPFGLSNAAATFQRFIEQVLRRMGFYVPYFDDVRFIPHSARTQAVLNNYLKGPKKNDRTPILWSEESAVAFEKCKKDLSGATVLYHPSADASFAAASDTAVGAALHQLTSKGWQPLAFFSKTLSPAQRRYSAYDREQMAAYMAIKYFRHMAEGRSFTLFTDHMPLVYAFKQKEDKCTPRQLRYSDLIRQFTTDIWYLKGSETVVADTLRRIHISTTNTPSVVDFSKMAREQQKDSQLQDILAGSCPISLVLQPFRRDSLQSHYIVTCQRITFVHLYQRFSDGKFSTIGTPSRPQE